MINKLLILGARMGYLRFVTTRRLHKTEVQTQARYLKEKEDGYYPKLTILSLRSDL